MAETKYAVTSFDVQHSFKGGENVIGCIIHTSDNKLECDRITEALRDKECAKEQAEHIHFTHQYIDGMKQFRD